YNETDPRINNVIRFPWIRLNVVDVQGPGYFSVWQTDDFGSPTVWVATAGNPQGPNLFFTAPGGHVDYNWAFSAPGNYTVAIQASAYLPAGTPLYSDVTRYYSRVDDPSSPHPGPGAGPTRESQGIASALAVTQAQARTGFMPPAGRPPSGPPPGPSSAVL